MSAAEKWEVGASPPTVRVDLKWSLWSKDRGTWEEHAPETLRHLDALGEEGADLTIYTGPKKEIRFGSVHLHFDPKTSTINAHVVFATEWDEFESVADTLGVAEDDEPTRAYLREALPAHAVGGDGAFGVVVEEDVSAPAGETDKLLAAIDAVEDRLLKEDEEAWRSIEASLKDEPEGNVGTTIFVVGFCPSGQGNESSVGGFEWRLTADEARNALQEFLSHDADLASDYVLRRVTLPASINVEDKDAVTAWLDGEASELWNTVAQ